MLFRSGHVGQRDTLVGGAERALGLTGHDWRLVHGPGDGSGHERSQLGGGEEVFLNEPHDGVIVAKSRDVEESLNRHLSLGLGVGLRVTESVEVAREVKAGKFSLHLVARRRRRVRSGRRDAARGQRLGGDGRGLGLDRGRDGLGLEIGRAHV